MTMEIYYSKWEMFGLILIFGNVISEFGICAMECDFELVGPSCNFKNIAYGKKSRHDSNIDPPHFSDEANDNDLSTCSYTSDRNTNTAAPWWNLWIPENTTFKKLEFVIIEDRRWDFHYFEVNVYNTTEDNFKAKGPLTDGLLCYKHNASIPKETKIEVTCDGFPYGNLIRIQLYSNQSQLVLCDFRLYEDCKDGFYGNGCEECNKNCFPSGFRKCRSNDGACLHGCKSGWAGVHCEKKCEKDEWGKNCDTKCGKCDSSTCDRISGDCPQGCSAGYKPPKCSEACDDGNYGKNCSFQCRTCAREKSSSICSHLDGVCFNGCETGYNGPRCNIECQNGTWGKNCEQPCGNCDNSTCNRYNGTCPGECTAGYTGHKCIDECQNGYYGKDCKRQCNNRCSILGRNATCDKVNGTCLNGCDEGYKGSFCDEECDTGKWGKNCSTKCGKCESSTCDRKTGMCPKGCSVGFKPSLCSQVCDDGHYGKNCSMSCRTCSRKQGSRTCNHLNGVCFNGCEAGYIGSSCDIECQNGTWGKNCEQTCGNCDSSTCDRFNGACAGGCSAGYTGSECIDECQNGYYGNDCISQCNKRCSRLVWNAICDKVNGTCLNGCDAGYKGSFCDEECEDGKWGVGCQQDCGKCLSSSCNNVNGYCSGECAPGYKHSRKCIEECDDGRYGRYCYDNCSQNCKDVCDKKTGNCSKCKAGWKGNNCSEECEDGKWGEGCQEDCGNCLSSPCNNVNGYCSGGCAPGYKHSGNCIEACSSGEWGENCQNVCGKCKNEETCRKNDGICEHGCIPGHKHTDLCNEECENGTYGETCGGKCSATCFGVCNKVNGTCDQCQAGWTGDFCETDVSLSPSHSSDASSAVSGIVATLAAIIAIVLVAIGAYIFQRKKQKNGRNHEANKLSDLNTDNKDVTSNDHKEEPSSSTLYVNVSAIKKARETRAKYPDRTYVNNYANESANEQMYSNSKVTNEVHLLEFEAYVKSGLLNTEIFLKQFQKLPYGMQYASDVATKPVNNSKNRYKLMYAYDHSRVILRTLPDLPCSDYINASNIMGESGKVAYIAAQGPITNTLGDFWRMIWEQNVQTIVMLTNLTEEGKMKCLKYWPDVGETVQHDNTTVVSELEDVFAEYTIRRLKAYQKNKPDRTRTLAHFHYTAWPDKDVPRSTSSLLHFWQQVRRHDWKKTRPWLVHCSAGVGRTGTYIAMDDLYDKGINGASIDVFKCVDDLRRQRVNMVQTKGQYKYLHFIVLEALVLPSKPVQVDDFHSVYNDLKKTDPSTGKTSLLMHYETLVNGKTVTIDDKDDERYAVARRDENKHKNRYEDILAPSDCRPFLLTKVPGCTDYINAVLIPGYRDHLGYIITQTPLQTTAVDCCRLIYEQDVQVVVTFQEREQKDVGLYLSYEEAAKFGPFTVKFIAEEERACYTRRNYLLVFKSETRTLTQLIYKNWLPSRPTPSDPTEMLNFLENLESVRRQADYQPVLLQCLNGAERSGLIVVLVSILQQLKFNKEVSIPLVIRQLKSWRQQIIPNFEQFKFCYDVVLSHIESHTTYANM